MTNRIAIVLTIFLWATSLTGAAHAESRVAVQDFHGPHASSMRTEVARVLALQRDVVVVPHREVRALARVLGADVRTPAGRQRVARELKLSAWITGRVKKRSHKVRLSLEIHDGAAGGLLGHVTLTERSTRSLKEAVREELWERSRDAMTVAAAPLPTGRAPIEDDPKEQPEQTREAAPAQAAPAGPEAPLSVMSAEEELARATVSSSARSAALAHDDSATFEGPRRQTIDALRATVGIGSPYRSLAYSDAISQSLGDYRLGGALMVDLGLTYHPARHVTDGWASWLGLDVGAQLAKPSSTSDSSGNAYTSRYSAYRLGVRGLVPVGRHAISLFSGYAASKLGIAPDDDDIESPTPDVDYRMVRTGAGAELALSDTFGLGFHAAWLHVLSVGEIGRWFPRATAAGLELALSASYAITRHLFARLSASYQRTAFDFNPRPGDSRVAGGATDQFLTASMGMGVNL